MALMVKRRRGINRAEYKKPVREEQPEDEKKEEGEGSEEDTDLTKETHEKHYSSSYVPWGITTFSQLDTYREAREKAHEYESMVWTLESLISNIMYADEIKNKTSALSALMDEFISRVKDVDEKEDEPSTLDQLNKEVAELGSLSGADLVNRKRQLRQEYRKLDAPIPDEIKGIDDSFMLWKEEDGSYRFAAIYSNNFRDDDNPPETISEKAHKAFTELANDGVVPMPELWHWHVPGTRWGAVDHLMYDNGFAIAFGHVDPGHEKEAELLATKDNLGVSHGMPLATLLRDPDDSSVIAFYTSREISPLPLTKAANKLTGFNVFLSEDDMQLSKEKREWLLGLGYTEDQLNEIQQKTALKKEQAETEGRVSKETPEVEAKTEEATQETEQKQDVGQEATTETPAAEKQETQPAATDTTKEVVEAVASVIKPLADMVLEVQKQVSDLATRVEGVEGTAQKQAKQMVEETPTLSLKELLSMATFGNPAAQIDGRSSLAKDGPVENKDADEFSVTGIGVLDKAIKANLVN